MKGHLVHGLLMGLLISGLAACDEGGASPDAPSRRSDGVKAAATGAPSATASATTAAPKPTRKLCVGQSERDTPAGLDVARSVSGPAPGPLTYGERWVWLNLWAAWCKPCKKELPLLIRWRDQLKREGVDVELAFVSIDDDEREMKRLLQDQPEGGMRASYWLADDEKREAFFTSLGFEDTPTLPVNAFVAPSGKLHCIVEGALEEGDFPAIAAMLKK